ncbi:MAG: hypothetical protein AAGA96_20270, partial [Verrucomicrobiota bacterium]
DSTAEAARFQRQYPDRASLEKLSVWEKPGLLQFIREEGFVELFARGWQGGVSQIRSSVLGRGGWILLYGLFVFLVVAAIHRWVMWKQSDEVWRVRGTSARWMLLFTFLALVLTFFYTGIGNQVIPNNAMTTSLFLPLLLTFIWIAERYRRQLQRTKYALVVNRVYMGLMILPIIWISFRVVMAVRSPMG